MKIKYIITTIMCSISMVYANNIPKYHNNNLTDKTQIKIWNGHIVENFQDYPYIASINQSNSDDPYLSHDCAGTFISDNFLLTAGHCVTKRDGAIVKPKDIVIYYGGVNLKTDKFHRLSVTNIYRYPKYSSHELGLPNNDLALIKIIPPKDINIQTVALPNSNLGKITQNQNIVRAIGWGFYKAFSPVSPELRYADQYIASKKDIDNYLNGLGVPYSSDMFNNQEMIGTSSPDGRRTTQGDSGGPLLKSVYFFGWKHIQIGIVSWGPDVPLDKFNASFYTNLNNKNYLSWISSVIGS